jgi:hypothetical protein
MSLRGRATSDDQGDLIAEFMRNRAETDASGEPAQSTVGTSLDASLASFDRQSAKSVSSTRSKLSTGPGAKRVSNPNRIGKVVEPKETTKQSQTPRQAAERESRASISSIKHRAVPPSRRTSAVRSSKDVTKEASMKSREAARAAAVKRASKAKGAEDIPKEDRTSE